MAARREDLIRRRSAKGYSQETFAAALSLDSRTVGRWERGETTPQPWQRPAIARLLSITLEELERMLRGQVGAAYAQDDRLAQVLGRPRTLDLVTVSELTRQVERLDQRYDCAPSAAMLAEAGCLLGQITFLTSQASVGRARQELRGVEATAATLMGQLVWDASQRKDHTSARTYFNQAIDAAREIGDTTLQGHAMLRDSYLYLYGERDAKSGLDLTRQIAATTISSSPALTGLALLHHAEAHAMLGDAQSCEITLAAAERQLSRPITGDPAGHLLSEAQFDRLAGSCYLFLGRHSRAQWILEKSARTTRQYSKSHAIVMGNLSLAHLRQGQLDAATSVLHEAIDVVEATRGGGGMNIVFDAGRELRDWRSERVVQDIYDRLLSLMTTA